jgi:hypothetical protein
MTNEQALKMWRESQTIWTPRKPGETWDTAWRKMFGNNHELPHDDEYDDGEGGIAGDRGILRIGEYPGYPDYGIVFVRVNPPHKQEIRLWRGPRQGQ